MTTLLRGSAAVRNVAEAAPGRFLLPPVHPVSIDSLPTTFYSWLIGGIATVAIAAMLLGLSYWVFMYCVAQGTARKALPFTLKTGTFRFGMGSISITGDAGDPADVDGAQDRQMVVLEKRVTRLEEGQAALFAAAQEVLDARTAKLLLTEESPRENRNEDRTGASASATDGRAAGPGGD